jgi:competence protein ComEC
MVIYDINGASNVDFTYGKSSYLLGGINDKTTYVVNQTRIQRGLLPVGEIVPDSNHFPEAGFNNLKVVAWQGKKIIFIAQSFPEGIHFTEKIAIDYLVISHDAIKNLEEITQAFTFTTLIIDSSNRYFTVKKLLHEAHEQGIDAYAVSEKGAYVVNFAHDSHRFF